MLQDLSRWPQAASAFTSASWKEQGEESKMGRGMRRAPLPQVTLLRGAWVSPKLCKGQAWPSSVPSAFHFLLPGCTMCSQAQQNTLGQRAENVLSSPREPFSFQSFSFFFLLHLLESCVFEQIRLSCVYTGGEHGMRFLVWLYNQAVLITTATGSVWGKVDVGQRNPQPDLILLAAIFPPSLNLTQKVS